MRIALAALLIALMSAPCLAQGKVGNTPKKEDTPAPIGKKSEDKDYKAAIERMPDQKFDPWRNMR